MQPTIPSWAGRSASHLGSEMAPPSAAVRNLSHWANARSSVSAPGAVPSTSQGGCRLRRHPSSLGPKMCQQLR